MISSINALRSKSKLQALINQKLSISVKLLIFVTISGVNSLHCHTERDFEEIEAFLKGLINDVGAF